VDGIVIQAGKGGKPRIDDLPQTTARLTGVWVCRARWTSSPETRSCAEIAHMMQLGEEGTATSRRHQHRARWWSAPCPWAPHASDSEEVEQGQCRLHNACCLEGEFWQVGEVAEDRARAAYSASLRRMVAVQQEESAPTPAAESRARRSYHQVYCYKHWLPW
jgi:hypothetical protein